MPFLRYGQPVTVINRSPGAPDDHGNDTVTTVTTVIDGCAISPGSSQVTLEGTEQVEADVTVHMPYGTDVNADDYIIVNGITFTVVGIPIGWQSPFTGTQSMVEVRGKSVTGGGAAT
jgi:head-tail adaptor